MSQFISNYTLFIRGHLISPVCMFKYVMNGYKTHKSHRFLPSLMSNVARLYAIQNMCTSTWHLRAMEVGWFSVHNHFNYSQFKELRKQYTVRLTIYNFVGPVVFHRRKLFIFGWTIPFQYETEIFKKLFLSIIYLFFIVFGCFETRTHSNIIA